MLAKHCFKFTGVVLTLGAISGRVAEAKDSKDIAAPSSLKAGAVSQTHVALQWLDMSNNEDAFLIERSPYGAELYQMIGKTAANKPSFVDEKATTGSRFDYRVRAHNKLGQSKPSNVATVQTAGPKTLQVPSMPVNVKLKAYGDAILLTWDNLTPNNGVIIRGKDDKSPNAEELARSEPNEAEIAVKGLVASTLYAFKLMAFNDAGESAPSRTYSILSAPGAPQLSAYGGWYRAMMLEWVHPAGGADAYRIEIALGNGSFELAIAIEASQCYQFFCSGSVRDPVIDAYLPGWVPPNFVAHELEDDTEYRFRVQAINLGGESAFSNVVAARTGEPLKRVFDNYTPYPIINFTINDVLIAPELPPGFEVEVFFQSPGAYQIHAYSEFTGVLPTGGFVSDVLVYTYDWTEGVDPRYGFGFNFHGDFCGPNIFELMAGCTRPGDTIVPRCNRSIFETAPIDCRVAQTWISDALTGATLEFDSFGDYEMVINGVAVEQGEYACGQTFSFCGRVGRDADFSNVINFPIGDGVASLDEVLSVLYVQHPRLGEFTVRFEPQ